MPAKYDKRRYERGPKVFVFTVALIASVMIWLWIKNGALTLGAAERSIRRPRRNQPGGCQCAHFEV